MDGIIVGVDESPNAARALRWAVDHAGHRHQPVTALMAWGYLDQHRPEPDQPFDPGYHESDARAALDEIVRRAIGTDRDVARLVVCDLAPRALVEAAAGASLVVVGARGLGGFTGLLLGSVSRQVVHHASCPVAVIHPGQDDARVDRIVVGVDGSSPARRALRWAVDEARARQIPVVAVHAWHQMVVGSAFLAPMVDIGVVQKAATEMLERELGTVDAHGLVAPVEVRVMPLWYAAPAVLEVADERTLVVVGRRGHGGFRGLLMGSVSDQVTHHAPGPVVVVPTPTE